MDTTTDTPATDLVVVEAEIVEDDPSGFGSEIAKNAGVSAATAGVVVLGIVAFKYLKPRVVSLIARKKTETPVAEPVEVTPEETPKQD